METQHNVVSDLDLDFSYRMDAIIVIFTSCCLNVYTLQHLQKVAPSSPLLTTFTQFLLITIATAPLQSKRMIPFSRYAILVLLFFSSSVATNASLTYNVPIPLFIIFRSLSLCVSLLLGLAYGTKYTPSQVIGVIFISVGILLTTWTSSPSSSTPSNYTFGVLLLVASVFLGSLLGLAQQDTYAKYGKEWIEVLYHTHLLSLPFFIPFYSQILEGWNGLQGDLMSVVANAVTQLGCVGGVYALSSRVSAVELGIVLSLRKFASLVISVVLFDDKLTVVGWIGCCCVFIGTFAYGNGRSKKKMD